jgi:hypothetical protein
MRYRSVNARRVFVRRFLSAVGISTVLAIGLAASAVAEQAKRFRIAEEKAPRPVDRVFFTYNYYANIAIEAGVSSGETPGGINNQRDPIGFEKTFFGGDVSVGMRLPFQVLDGAQQSFAVGVKIRSYVGDVGDPNQALTHYSRDWMIMPYAAMPVAFITAGQPPGGTQFVITPFVGPIFEHGDLSIFNNQGRASVTRHGVGFGLNFDVLLPSTGAVQTFIGFGGQLSAMQTLKERIDGFDVQLDDRVEARAVVRGGFFIR